MNEFKKTIIFSIILTNTFVASAVFAEDSKDDTNNNAVEYIDNASSEISDLQGQLDSAEKKLKEIQAEDEIKKLKIDTKTYFPDLEIKSSTNIRLDMTNLGPANLYDVKITLESLPAGVSLKSGLSPDVNIGSFLVGNTKEIVYNLETSQDAQVGTYPITYKLNANYGLNSVKTYETSKVFYIKVVKSKDQKQTQDELKPAIIKNISHPSSIKKGEIADFKFSVQNPNNAALKSVKVTVEPQEGLMNQSQNTFILNNFGANETKNMTVKLFGKDDAERKNYSIKVMVEDANTDPEANEKNDEKKSKKLPTSSQYSGIFYDNPAKKDKEEEKDNSVKNPQIIISNYNYGKSHITPGEEFDLSMTFLNTSTEKNLRNIKISITSEENTFIPIHSSNSIYIGNLNPNSSVDKILKFTTNADAKTQNVPVNIDYTYEDNKGNALTSKETISIPVMQKTILSIDEVQPPQQYFEGEPASINVSFYNLGKTQISNLKITAEGSFHTEQDPVYFLGNMEPGKSDSYSLQAFPNDPKKIDGKIIFNFDTIDGQNITMEKEFNLELNPMPVVQEGMDNMPVEEKKKVKPLPIIIGAIIGSISGVVIYKKRKKAKENAELNIDDEL